MTMRGLINGTSAMAQGRTEINVKVPLAELTDFHSRLKSLTGGEGSYTLSLSHYAPTTPKVQKALFAGFKPGED